MLDFNKSFQSLNSIIKFLSRKRGKGNSSLGFTLVELIIAILISAIVTIVAGSALFNILSMNQRASTQIERRIDLSRAFDFISYEVKTSQRVNSSSTTVLDGSSISLEQVIASTGLNLASLGTYETLVLYLELPMGAIAPAVCPAGTTHAGSPPPAPSDYDRVIYDIRPNPSNWLSPRIISRYGRIPSSNGTLDPCEEPVSSDVLVDSISDTDITPAPSCAAPGVLSGKGGFFACVNGGLVDIYLQSKSGDLQTHNLSSKAFSRSSSQSTLAVPVLSSAGRSGTDNLNLTWSWNGTSGATFKLYRVIGGTTAEVYSGTAQSFSAPMAGNSGDTNCYTVTASLGSYTSDYSDRVCEAK